VFFVFTHGGFLVLVRLVIVICFIARVEDIDNHKMIVDADSSQLLDIVL